MASVSLFSILSIDIHFMWVQISGHSSVQSSSTFRSRKADKPIYILRIKKIEQGQLLYPKISPLILLNTYLLRSLTCPRIDQTNSPRSHLLEATVVKNFLHHLLEVTVVIKDLCWYFYQCLPPFLKMAYISPFPIHLRVKISGHSSVQSSSTFKSRMADPPI